VWWCRPRYAQSGVFDALEKALQGTSAILPSPKPKVSVKASTLESVEYEASGFIADMGGKTEARTSCSTWRTATWRPTA
jgi:hypothetical protein